jgi:hypothetical protein
MLKFSSSHHPHSPLELALSKTTFDSLESAFEMPLMQETAYNTDKQEEIPKQIN